MKKRQSSVTGKKEPGSNNESVVPAAVNKLMSAPKMNSFMRIFIILMVGLVCFTNIAKADYTIASGNSVNASTLTGQSGTLTINGTLLVSSDVSLLNFTTVIINGPNGKIYWSGNPDLTFSASVSITINNGAPGLQPTGGNASQRLYIGSTLIAVSNDNANNAAFSFDEFNQAGGLPQFIMSTSVSSVCSNSSFTATITPLNTNVHYDCTWAISAAGTKSPSSHSNFNSPKTTTITPSSTGTYTISCTLYKTGDDDAIVTKTKTVTVNAVPGTPTSTSATPSTICQGSPSNIKATSSGNTIQWYTVSTGGTNVGSSASATNFSVSPSSTTTYYAEALITATGCTSASRSSAAITVNPVSVGGSISGSNTVCSGSNSSILTLSGYTGTITRWESSADNFVSSPTTISNTTASFTANNLSATTYYRAVVTSGICSAAYSSVAVVTVSNPGTWLGVNTDWNSSLNWCNGSIPTSSTNVVISNGLSFYPVITGTASANNITVATGGSALVTVTGTLKLAGTITATNGINTTSGTIEFIGTASQSVRGDNFVSGTIANLKVTNTLSSASAANPSVAINAAGGMLSVSGTVSFGNLNNAFLKTNDDLTLLSSAASTAAIADITNNNVNTGNSITGKVVIERFIPGKRAWRLLTAPVTSASNVKMSDSWQEGAASVTNPAVINSSNNPNSGYGTHVCFGNPATNGFDQGPNGNSSIYYMTTTGWNGVPAATNNGAAFNSGYITDQPGYMLFVRGDRSTMLSSGTAAATSDTRLRIKGNINTGLLNIPLGTSLVSGSSKFRVVGNPYASAVNFHKIAANAANVSGGFADAFYLWDPTITGSNGVGGWVAMSYNSSTGVYDRTVVSGGSSNINNTGDIQSGSAFVIDYSGASTSLQIKESNKATGSNNTQFKPAAQPNQLRVTLLAKNADNTISVNDGLLVSYDDAYSNEVDNADMKKLSNFSENFSVVNQETLLAIERRQSFAKTDSISFRMSKMKQKSYQLEFTLDNLDAPAGTTAILEDKFLGAKTVLDTKKTSYYDFSINGDAASANADRFRLLFNPAAEFTSVNGTLQDKNVLVEWALNEEFNIDHFEIERSSDGSTFSHAGTVSANGNSAAPVTYSWTDMAPAAGNYSYRIKAVSKNGVMVYSNKADVTIISSRAGMFVFPNPVTGNTIHLQMNGENAGVYNTKLTDLSGKSIATAVIHHQGGASTQSVSLPAQTAAGTYLLKVSDTTGKSTLIKVFVQKN